MYLIRLDDAAENMHEVNWNKIEKMLDKYKIKPLIGVIPNNQDESLLGFSKVSNFWERVKLWEKKGYIICMHGFNHVYSSKAGGINPVNSRSEFAGEPYGVQKRKIKNSNEIFAAHNIFPQVFFAPSHTFDKNTLKALKECTNIRIISDTIANDIYFEDDFYFIPQQSGIVRKLPFKITTFCYHPNQMKENDFVNLEKFIQANIKKFGEFSSIKWIKRKRTVYDLIIKKVYFMKRNLKKVARK